MKLNPDCIRDILLAVEESTDSTQDFHYIRDEHCHDQLRKYDHNEIYYHLKQCHMSGFFTSFLPCDGGDIVIIRDLTPAGHAFLANIRNNTFWDKVKDIGNKIGTPALGSLLQIAENLATELISGYFKLN